jgi:formylglycine-generating enzyme required for sulfatase activity
MRRRAGAGILTATGLDPIHANRVLRGGSWNNDTNNVRSSNRNNNTPGNTNNNNGFRVASTRGCTLRACEDHALSRCE